MVPRHVRKAIDKADDAAGTVVLAIVPRAPKALDAGIRLFSIAWWSN